MELEYVRFLGRCQFSYRVGFIISVGVFPLTQDDSFRFKRVFRLGLSETETIITIWN